MKDSMGSVVLINIFIIFIVIYISLMSSIINYTKVFRVKNRIIEIIERYGGYTRNAEEEIEELFKDADMGYLGEYPCTEVNEITTENVTIKDKLFKCEIQKFGDNKIVGSYYKVAVYVEFDIPLRKESIIIPLSGETKTVREKDTDYNPQEVTYYVVNEEFVLPDIDLDLSTAGSPSNEEPIKVNCSNYTVCSSGAKKKINGVYQCLSCLGENSKLVYKNGNWICQTGTSKSTPDKSNPQCNLNLAGRKMSSDKGICSWVCPSVPVTYYYDEKMVTEGFYNISVYIYNSALDPSYVGYDTGCTDYSSNCVDLLGIQIVKKTTPTTKYTCTKAATKISYDGPFNSNIASSCDYCPSGYTKDSLKSSCTSVAGGTCSAINTRTGKSVLCTCKTFGPFANETNSNVINDRCYVIYSGTNSCYKYICPTGSILKNNKCYKYNQAVCENGWTKVISSSGGGGSTNLAQ